MEIHLSVGTDAMSHFYIPPSVSEVRPTCWVEYRSETYHQSHLTGGSPSGALTESILFSICKRIQTIKVTLLICKPYTYSSSKLSGRSILQPPLMTVLAAKFKRVA